MTDVPKYSYADELYTPKELGITRGGSFGNIMRAVAGVNYYTDAIGFGSATGLAKLNGLNQRPLGIRYFLKTGLQCSNGADMYDYVDTVPKGDILGKRITNELRAMNLPTMQGMAPGMMEDSISALNPMPLIRAASGSGYPQCKKVSMPVGDNEGRVKSRFDASNIWITEPYQTIKGQPTQTRWVFDKWMSMEEYDAVAKTESPEAIAAAAEAKKSKERFTNFIGNEQTLEEFTEFLPSSQLAGGALLAILAVGLLTHYSSPRN
jgi:hypothetical protein